MAKYSFERFGVMIDMSRNAVMNLDALKRYMTILKKMGYNMVMLYTEDTYELNDNPYFGYLRGRYSKEEMKEIDEFASSIGVEIIPCIQTLAHLNAYIQWGKTPIDCNDILLTDDERTYNLIDKMFETLSECFKSRLIHIGMDEAHMLGRGKHLDKFGYEKAETLMIRHLDKVRELAKKYGYTPMLWSDMFFRSWNNGKYAIPRCEMPKEITENYPKDVIPVYWDYYQSNKQVYDDMFFNHKQFSDNIWFAGGAWCWSGLAPFNQYTLTNMVPAMRSCRENKIKNIFITLWGDDGAECSHFSQLATLLHIIEFAKGNEDMDSIKKKCKRLLGIEYDDLMKTDIPNQISDDGRMLVTPSKYMLYSDPFAGYLDYTVKEGVGKIYEEHAKALSDIAKKYRKYAYIFNTEAKLCEVLTTKYELGFKTRKAYKANDKEELLRIVADYTLTIKKVKEFHKLFSIMWNTDNKPHGFDIQDKRLGGLILRLESCKNTLVNFIKGKISSIPELDEEILPYGKYNSGEPIYINSYAKMSSVNVLTHNVIIM